MTRKRIAAAAVVLVLAAAALLTGMLPKPLPKNITPDWIRANELYGVTSRDARGSDFTGLNPADLALLSFDCKTRWPDPSRLPRGFQPGDVLEAAKDPGLGIRDLHRQGITGKGISVAVIDKYILPEHRELAGRIKYIEVFPKAILGREPHFHGMAAASILAGESVGVAPGAFLYYFAVPDDMDGFKNYIPALEQILALNESLPKEQKIRLVSVSWGPDGKDAETQSAWLALVKQARAQGMEIVYSEGRSVVSYSVAGALPGRDRNDPNAYEWARWLTRRGGPSGFTLGVPASYRTTASVAAPDAYVYWGDSGVSWAIPYVGGLLALGLQVDPDATFIDLWRALEQTAARNARGVPMPNPAAYIAAVRR